MTYDNHLSLCIPRIEDGITEKYIRDIFTTLDIGSIRTIIIKKANKKNSRKVFINLNHWNTNKTSETIKTRLNNNLPVNIMYSMPWYWKIKYAY